MNSEVTDYVRLLPWTGAHGQPCLLLTDGDGGAVSRLADQVEEVQLGLAERLLDRVRQLLESREPDSPAGLLADALGDALLIARSRGDRLGGSGRAPVGGADPAPRAYGLLTLPGRDLTSAGTARRYVRDTGRSWGLPPGTVDDLETIAGELVANALEHGDSRTVTVTCDLTAGTATIGVTQERPCGGAPVIATPPGPPGSSDEHGRGLLITNALATRWGSRRTAEGLTVWAEVTAGAGSMESHRRA